MEASSSWWYSYPNINNTALKQIIKHIPLAAANPAFFQYIILNDEQNGVLLRRKNPFVKKGTGRGVADEIKVLTKGNEVAAVTYISYTQVKERIDCQIHSIGLNSLFLKKEYKEKDYIVKANIMNFLIKKIIKSAKDVGSSNVNFTCTTNQASYFAKKFKPVGVDPVIWEFTDLEQKIECIYKMIDRDQRLLELNHPLIPVKIEEPDETIRPSLDVYQLELPFSEDQLQPMQEDDGYETEVDTNISYSPPPSPLDFSLMDEIWPMEADSQETSKPEPSY